MSNKTRKNSLQVLTNPESSGLQPARTLGQAGKNLWSRITEEYDLSDAGGRELLLQCCQALDRVESLRRQIDQEGEIIRVKGVPKAHPALRDELANRSFIAKSLQRLGLALEVPVRSVGRPLSGGLGIKDVDWAAGVTEADDD